MDSTTPTRMMWIAYGASGVIGSIRKSEEGYVVTMAGADAPLGAYPSMEAAKGAVNARQPHGSDWPRFVEH